MALIFKERDYSSYTFTGGVNDEVGSPRAQAWFLNETVHYDFKHKDRTKSGYLLNRPHGLYWMVDKSSIVVKVYRYGEQVPGKVATNLVVSKAFFSKVEKLLREFTP